MIGFYEYLRKNGEAQPDKLAVVCSDKRKTYRELNEEIDKLAWGFRETGIDQGSVVALVMKNSIEMVECLFALWKLGAVAAPLNFRETDENIDLMLRISGAEYLICETSLERRLPIAKSISFIATDTGIGRRKACSLDKLKSGGKVWRGEPIDDDAELLYIFTSGTTGVPKAAVHTNAALTEFTFRCFEFGGLYSPDDVFLSYSPLFHIGGIRIMISNLVCGATLVLTTSFAPETIVETIRNERVTQMLVIPPSMVLRLRPLAEKSSTTLSSIRMIRVSGGLCTEQACATLFDCFGDVTLVNGYGSSESAISTFNIVSRDEYLKNPEIIRSVGKPLPGCEIKLMTKDGCQITEPFAVGEAYGRCRYKFKRYKKLDGVEYPDEWFDTGDILSSDADGNYYFAGRKRDIIKTGGENVFSGEVEATLLKHPAIAECAVFRTAHETLGEAISAAIVLKPGFVCNGKDIIEFCRDNMASYKKPIRIYFVNSLPKTASGKIRKNCLEEMAANGDL